MVNNLFPIAQNYEVFMIMNLEKVPIKTFFFRSEKKVTFQSYIGNVK